MEDLTGKKVLFFSPKFFNYEVEIQNQMRQLGAEVRWFDERPSNDFLTKVLIRLNNKFVKQKIESYYGGILKFLSEEKSHFDYILIISPECLSKEIVAKFKATFANARVILYMWDSFKNKGALDLLPEINRAVTFDPIDAKRYSIQLLPLFYIDSYRQRGGQELYDLLFIGTAHSDRYIFVKKVLTLVPDSVKMRTYFFLSNKKLYWMKKIFDSDFKGVKFDDISFIALSNTESSALVHQSRIILDINHPDQIGLTMRTIETLGAQKKLITTNKDVINYDFYDDRNILVLDRNDPCIPKEFLESPFHSSSHEILWKYSIKGWVLALFEINTLS